MKKGRVVILIVLLFAMIAVTSTLIAAWLTDKKSTSSTTFTVGDVEFTWNGAMIPTTNPIVPGQNLIQTPFYLANTSTVTSQLRVQILATYKLEGSSESVDAIPLFKDLSLMTGWTLSEDGKWYHDADIATTDTTIDVIDTLVLDGSKVGNTFSKASFTVQFVFEAKQKEYVTWEELGTAVIDFSTGI
ncbi:MAG TPA: hypothetical protein VIK96_01145 [Bacilli bacterium]